MAKTGKKEEVREYKSFGRVAFEYIRVIAIGVVVAVFITLFVIINAEVPTGSMENTIMTGDRLFGNRLVYYFRDPQRGEIAIFETPDPAAEKGTLYIKRVIGLPGETIEFREGEIYITPVDGEKFHLEEPYLKEEIMQRELKVNNQTITLGEDEFFMCGDNRNSSCDSRYWGPVKRKAIKAKALLRYWGGFKTF